MPEVGKELAMTSSFSEQNPELLHLCNFALAVLKMLEEVGEATDEEISTKCGIPYSRVNAVLNCLKQDGYVVSHGRKIKRYALRYRDPELSCLWPTKDKAK